MVGRMLRRWLVTLSAGAVLASMGCLWLGAGAGTARPIAQSARTRTINTTEDASLYLVKKSGAVLNERGTMTGTLAGPVTARFVTSLVQVSGTVTVSPRGGGTLTITVLGYPRSTGTVAKFSGSISVKSGTGRYAHAKGSGTFSGTVNRRTWAATVHTKAKLTY